MFRRLLCQDLFLLGCIAACSTLVWFLEEFLGDLYMFESVDVGPQDYGWWTTRKRRYFKGICREGEIVTTAPLSFLRPIFGESRL
mmetsp:Transcript_39211/g.107956  ORF Transcript_39211/g.107956 Transcript_39211/m.107956 type:complete len:85 (-) Transcript_39211:483-737(-)